jgi:hypothetical protein
MRRSPPDNSFASASKLAKHIRNKHGVDMRCTGQSCDSHGHVWYCFKCETLLKDHRSFNSDNAAFDHVLDCHGIKIESTD